LCVAFFLFLGAPSVTLRIAAREYRRARQSDPGPSSQTTSSADDGKGARSIHDRGRSAVAQLLHAGCTHMRKAARSYFAKPVLRNRKPQPQFVAR
jgi:hypothetical protein